MYYRTYRIFHFYFSVIREFKFEVQLNIQSEKVWYFSII